MIGEDAVSVYTQLLMKFVDLLAKIGEEKRQNDLRKPPKIKCGSLSKKNLSDLMSKGTEFKFVSVPKDKADGVEKAVKDLGGSFFKSDAAETDTVMFAVPKSQVDLMNTAIKSVVSESMKMAPDSLLVKENKESIAAEDMPLVSDMMNRFDIPAMPFKNKNGDYTVIVPAEYDGQYKEAMNKVGEIKARLDNVDVMTFEQQADLERPDTIAKELSYEESVEISEAIKSGKLKAEIARYDDKRYAVYERNQLRNVDNILDTFHESQRESEEYLLTLNDNSVTIDKETLLFRENDDEYFIKVPNTHGLDYIKLNKTEIDEINDGKTIRAKIEAKKYYPVYDRNGAFRNERVGNELYRFFDVKHKRINKDTKVVEYGDRINRIDFFNKDKNVLISIGIDTAENMRAALTENGISGKAADNLLKDIDKMLSEKPDYEEYRSTFNYTEEKPEIVYADVPNIGSIIAQTQLSEMLIGKAECIGELPKDNGPRICVLDKSSNKFTVIPDKNRNTVISRLSEMGYDEHTARQIMLRAVNGPDPQDVEEPAEHFMTSNAELANVSYKMQENGIVIVREDDEKVRYMCIEKGTAAKDIEKALTENFGITDKISAAECMRLFAGKGIVEIPEIHIKEAAVTKLTDAMIGIKRLDDMDILNKDKGFVIMPVNKLDKERLVDIGISEDTVSAIRNSLARSERTAGKTGNLGELIAHAKEAIAKIPEMVQGEKAKVQTR